MAGADWLLPSSTLHAGTIRLTSRYNFAEIIFREEEPIGAKGAEQIFYLPVVVSAKDGIVSGTLHLD